MTKPTKEEMITEVLSYVNGHKVTSLDWKEGDEDYSFVDDGGTWYGNIYSLIRDIKVRKKVFGEDHRTSHKPIGDIFNDYDDGYPDVMSSFYFFGRERQMHSAEMSQLETREEQLEYMRKGLQSKQSND